jgi:hypothetical protein
MVARTMSQRATLRANSDNLWRGAVSALGLALLLPACGGAVASGVAAGKIGREVGTSAAAVPQGAEVCALKEALSAPPGGGGPEKPLSETCAKSLKSDELWRRSMVVLGAYGGTLDGLAAGGKSETTGPLEAALTGVSGSDWIAVDENPEKAAREAVSQLVSQMSSGSAGGDLSKAVKDAAPHVKTLCDGLAPYLETQAKGLADIQKDIEKRRTTRNDRRCSTLDNRSICVSESVIDRVVYGSTFGRAAALEEAHLDAHRAVLAFCAAHRKLEDAAAKGDLKDDGTYRDVVAAVKSVKRETPEGASGDAGAAKSPAAPKK